MICVSPGIDAASAQEGDGDGNEVAVGSATKLETHAYIRRLLQINTYYLSIMSTE